MSLEPNTCLTVIETGAGRRILKLDLVGGTQTEGPSITQDGKPLLSEGTSIGVKDDEMWLCNSNQGVPYVNSQTVTKVSLETGIGTAYSVQCRAVTASAQGIFVLENDAHTVTRYVDEAAIIAGTPAGTSSSIANSYSIGAGSNGALTSRYQEPRSRPRPDRFRSTATPATSSVSARRPAGGSS